MRARSAAVASAVVAVGAATLMGLTAGIASASGPGECTENVNVRAEPSIDSEIVALCEAGTAVETGMVRNGFVEITDLGGWAAEEFIAVDASAPASAPSDSSPSGSSPSDSSSSDSDSPSVSTTPDEDDTTADDATGTGTTGTDERAPRTTGPTADDASTEPSGNSFDEEFGSNSTDEPEADEIDEPAEPASGLGGGLI